MKAFVLEEFDREIVENQLYYHNHEHINNVQRRANAIFQVICPYWQASLGNKVTPEYITRINLLLELCAVASRMQGDAFSDNVNLTARLEGLTKF